MNYTYTQLARVLPESYRRQVWRARAQPAVEALSADRGRHRDRDRQRHPHDHVFHPAAALRVARETGRTARAAGVDAESRAAPTSRRRVNTDEDPRHLRPLSRFGGRAPRRRRAGLRRAGGAAVAAQERRRRFRRAPIEWCLDHAGLEPADLDAVVFYERSLLKFERILTCTLRAFPRSWRSFPHAMKNSLGEKVWVRGIISSHLGVPASKILFTRHHESHAAAAFLTAPTRRAAILTADGVGEWATLTVGHGERRAGRPHRDHRSARDPVPAFARHALFDVHGLSRLRGQRGRVQGDGPRRLRAADDDRAGPQGDPAHRRRRLRARPGVLRVPDDRRAIVFRRGSSICSGRRATPTIRSTSRPPRAGASPTAPPACSACSRTRWSTSRARSIAKPACPISASAAAWR